ncbi:conserved hypothetical protein [Trichinella spiralis]|uniref:hypothetical protein n=1 Tax=Trichinella spiralis TaxID=6334 RepID=UPI0001EFED20|nr:conserved hypothetical protein [Trichinella spiralis]
MRLGRCCSYRRSVFGNARLVNQKVFHCMKCEQLTCGQCPNGKKKTACEGRKWRNFHVLVARGFSQRLGEDYDETFATVARHEIIRTLLSIAAVKSLHVRHFDIKCAYSKEKLQEKL